MYFHPMQEEIDNMSDEQIGNRIRELSKKLASARRFGRNPDLINQLSKALNSYSMTLKQKRIKGWVDDHKKKRGEPDLGELINID
jgi:hypothetical protein